MKTTHKAIINFAYFTANFPPDFIERCWGKDHWLYNHLMSKLKSHSNGSFIDKGGFMNFFMDLDNENRQKLLDWIEENYLSFQNLKYTENVPK